MKSRDKGETHQYIIGGSTYRYHRSRNDWIVVHVTKIGAIAFDTVGTLAEARAAALAHHEKIHGSKR